MTRKDFPAVPLGVLGYATGADPSVEVMVPNGRKAPVVPNGRRGGPPTVRGVGGKPEPVLGGWPVAREAVRVLRREVRLGRRAARDAAERTRGRALWPSVEREVYRGSLETLALSSAPNDGEDERAWGERLDRGFVALRGRLDAAARRGIVATPPSSRVVRAPASDDLPLLPPRPDEAKGSTRQWRSYAEALERREAERAARP